MVAYFRAKITVKFIIFSHFFVTRWTHSHAHDTYFFPPDMASLSLLLSLLTSNVCINVISIFLITLQQTAVCTGFDLFFFYAIKVIDVSVAVNTRKCPKHSKIITYEPVLIPGRQTERLWRPPHPPLWSHPDANVRFSIWMRRSGLKCTNKLLSAQHHCLPIHIKYIQGHISSQHYLELFLVQGRLPHYETFFHYLSLHQRQLAQNVFVSTRCVVTSAVMFKRRSNMVIAF